MGSSLNCSQCFLVLISSLFSLFGLFFLVVGSVARFGSHLLDDILRDSLNTTQRFLGQAGSSSTLSSFNLGDYLQSATLAFIILGVFFFMLGILGCVGACCKVKCCLIVYAVIIGLIMVAEIVVVVLAFVIRDDIQKVLEKPLYKSLENDFIGINSSDAISLGWHFAMVTFKCCGVENYTDFDNAKRWVKTYNAGTNNTVNLTVPVACCKLNAAIPACAVRPTRSNANIDKGCYDAIEDFLEDNMDILIGVGAGVLVLQMLLFFCTIRICRADSRKKYEEDS